MKFILVIFLAWACCAFGPQVIYGEDNRKNLYDVMDARVLSWADSTVALIAPRNLIRQRDGSYQINMAQYGRYFGLCSTERYYSEPIAPDCTGFLVAPDIVVTAGHCVPSASFCLGSYKFVFGFSLKHPEDHLGRVPAREVYSCREVLHKMDSDSEADFAVIRLDRPVVGHRPLRLRTQGIPKAGTPLVLIGHPSGLPTKVADDAFIRSVHIDYFNATTDSFEGNSGSPVFNSQTGEVEGVLIRGEDDFEKRGECNVAKTCKTDECQGEDVSLISQVLPHIP